jgi:hypothetical protein
MDILFLLCLTSSILTVTGIGVLFKSEKNAPPEKEIKFTSFITAVCIFLWTAFYHFSH